MSQTAVYLHHCSLNGMVHFIDMQIHGSVVDIYYLIDMIKVMSKNDIV